MPYNTLRYCSHVKAEHNLTIARGWTKEVREALGKGRKMFRETRRSEKHSQDSKTRLTVSRQTEKYCKSNSPGMLRPHMAGHSGATKLGGTIEKPQHSVTSVAGYFEMT